MSALARLVRHLWLDADDARRALDATALARLETRVRDSEARHTGEICICVEASLPLSYLRRHLAGAPIETVVRERAVTQFGKLRVWDTEFNNGVLIYLLLAEHSIEILADRALARLVQPERWQATVAALGEDFRAGKYEQGLMRAIDDVDAALEAHFPVSADVAAALPRENQLPNRPFVG